MTLPRDSGAQTWFCVRRNGAARRGGWIDERTPDGVWRRSGAAPGDAVEACFAERFRPVAAKDFAKVFFNRARGVVGMEMTLGGETRRLAPTTAIASNTSFARALEKFLACKAADAELFRREGRLRAFDARQLLLHSGPERRAEALVRGSTPVAPTWSDAEPRAAELARGVAGWMCANLSGDGALPYKYWPSRGEASTADNAIRRFLGSLSLARYGDLTGSADIREAAARNLRFNMKRYFRTIGEGRGAIVERAGAKLGAAALAGLAILASARAGEFREELAMLARGVNALTDDEHGFRTFFFPPERDGENWNFYSGEALLFWAESMRQGLPTAPTPERCVEVFEKCRARHFRKRNPAFVPWHAQACASLFAQTGRRAFADFTLEISDWLLPMQQWSGIAPDLQGRFYNPRHPEFGPPHASSTGVYLEGLADAAALARALGDGARLTAYWRAINRGLRSLRQLQFRDRRDAFYISKPERALGALRTEAYDNAVRVDSAAHALAAAVKILRPTDFGRQRPATS